MKSIYTELALYDNKKQCARTDTVFLTISEVCNGTVSLIDASMFLSLLALGTSVQVFKISWIPFGSIQWNKPVPQLGPLGTNQDPFGSIITRWNKKITPNFLAEISTLCNKPKLWWQQMRKLLWPPNGCSAAPP